MGTDSQINMHITLPLNIYVVGNITMSAPVITAGVGPGINRYSLILVKMPVGESRIGFFK